MDTLETYQAPNLNLLGVVTEDASAEAVSAWLPIAARSLSGAIDLQVLGRERETEVGNRCTIDLPCFEKATYIRL
jgi:hypothetical protein